MCEVSDFKKPVLREILTTELPIRFPQKKRFLRKSDYRMTTRFFPNSYLYFPLFLLFAIFSWWEST